LDKVINAAPVRWLTQGWALVDYEELLPKLARRSHVLHTTLHNTLQQGSLTGILRRTLPDWLEEAYVA
jgi:hypothetical protein